MRRDLATFSKAAIVFAAVVLVLFLPDFFKGLSPFWGDLTYLQHPWRAFDAQELMAGRPPLWNPYAYFGMPQIAMMQSGTFYPASVLFFFFNFSTALVLFYLLHYFLGCFFSYLWVRSLGFSHAAGLGGGFVFGLSGVLLSREPFFNHLSVLAFIPAFALLTAKPLPLGLALACGFFCGYPSFLVGGFLCAWAASLIAFGIRKGAADIEGNFLGGLSAAAFSSVLIFPAVELFGRSVRADGIGRAEAWKFGFQASDSWRWISPALGGLKNFNPGVGWWNCVYFGFMGSGAVLAGVFIWPRKKSLALGSWIVLIALLTQAGSNPVSSWLWLHGPLLKFIRYPGNLAYLVLIPAVLLACAAFESLPRFWRLLIVPAAAAELFFYAFGAFATAPSAFFSFKGPLVEFLQKNLGRDRYLLSPLALESDRGRGIWDWKARLYGLTNTPFRIASAGNFGQPLVPVGDYALMDKLYGSSAAEASRFFRWADVRYALTPGPVSSPLLSYRGKISWRVYQYEGPGLSRAYFLSSVQAAELLPGPEPPPEKIKTESLDFSADRPDQWSVAGNGKHGWVFVSEPRYPGWKTFARTPLGFESARSFKALGAFQKISVPAGWRLLSSVYDPWTFRAGVWISVLSLAAAAFYGAFALRRFPIGVS